MSQDRTTKPIVFLSHSSKDREQLLALKALLDERFGNAISFFLSADGESLRIGTNWMAEIGAALKKAKLMFLFVSRNSTDSLWMHFEAGNAYGKIRVVPVCMPGVSVDELRPPLSQLHGFNLHSAGALSSLVDDCNKEFGLRMRVRFTPQEFHKVFAPAESAATEFFGRWTSYVSYVRLEATVKKPKDTPCDLISDFAEAYAAVLPDVRIVTTVFDPNSRQIEAPGASIRQLVSHMGDPENTHLLEASFSPTLFHLHAPVLVYWHANRREDFPVRLRIAPSSRVEVLSDWPLLTASLFQSPIEIAGPRLLRLHDLTFLVLPEGLQFEYAGNINRHIASELLSILVQRRVLTPRPEGKHQSALGEMLFGFH